MIEGIRNPLWDIFFGLVTRFGEETLAIVFMCAIYWCISKKTAYTIGIVYFLSGLTVQGMKICFRVPRPWIVDPTFNPVPEALHYATGYAFPSGHTQSAAALLGAIGTCIQQKLIRWVCFVLILLVGFSRMYLGVHTIEDVVVSIILTALLIWLTVKVLVRDDASRKHNFFVSLSMVLYAGVVIVIAAVLWSGGTISQANLVDSLKIAGASAGWAVGMYIERTYINFSVRSKNIWIHVLKFALGLAGVLALQQGLKPIIGDSLAADTFRYFIMTIWMTVFYPLIIKRFFTVKEDLA